MKQNIRFVEYSGCQLGKSGTDLSTDQWSQSIILETLRRYFRLDPSGVFIDGWVDDGVSKKLHLSIWVDGEVYQSYTLQSLVTGHVGVHLPTAQHIKQDPFKKLADAWLKILGFPKEFPRALEIEIRQDGLLTLECCPSF